MIEAPVKDGLLGRVLANAGLLLGGRGVNAFISLGYMAVAARALGVADFGVLVLINTFAQFVGDVVRFQSWQTVLQFAAAPLAADDRTQVQRVVRFALVLDLIGVAAGAAIGVAGALLATRFLGVPEAMAGPTAFYALSVAALVPSTQLGLLRLFDRFGPPSAQSAVSSTVRLIGGGIGMATRAPLEFFLLVWALGTLTAFAYVAACAHGELRRRDLLAGFAWSGPLTEGMPKAWRFAWATNAASTVEAAFTHLATLAVGALLGATEAGLWRIARQIADALAKPARLLIPALYPELAKLRAAGDPAGMRRLALRVGLVGGGFATLVLMVALVAGGPLLALVMGAEFAAAGPTMSWQVAAAAIGVWALPLEPMLVSMGRPALVLWVRLAVAVAFLAALPPVIEAHGLPGAGAALVGAAIATALGMLWSLRHITRGADRKQEILASFDGTARKPD